MRRDRNVTDIHEIFEYVDGRLYWKERPLCHFVDKRSWASWNTRYSGKEAGTPDNKGYISITCKGERFKRHQLIWIYFKGVILAGQEVDHVSGDTTDDRIENLRISTKSQNQTNRGRNRNNSSGIKGLRHHQTKTNDYWLARFTVSGVLYMKSFPFTEEGKLEAVIWLEHQRKERQGDFYCNRS